MIRSVSESDTEPYISMMSDHAVNRFLGPGYPKSREELVDYLRSCMQQDRETGIARYAVCLTDGTFIGLCGFRTMEMGTDLGWRLAPQFWGHGYATEAADAVHRYGIDSLKLDDIYVVCDPANRASIAVAKRIGFRFDSMVRINGNEMRRYLAGDIHSKSFTRPSSSVR